MQIYPIKDVILETNIVVFSPHFDDFTFMLGGYINELKMHGLLHTKTFHINLIFTLSNYLAGTFEGNYDTSLDRLKLATGRRLLEDLGCLDELLGEFNYRYELMGEKECFTRSKPFADSEMEFPHGMYEDFDEQDIKIFERMKQLIRKSAAKENTALIFPIAIKEHIDHFIVREAAISVAKEMGNNANASFYFQEDKPYGGIATIEELNRIESFIQDNNLLCKVYEFDPEKLIDLTFRHYISQVEEVYKVGIKSRGSLLQKSLQADCPCDRICLFGKMT